MNVIYGAAESMKMNKYPRNRRTDRIKQNKAWFDTDCDKLRQKAIRALRNFRNAQTAQTLADYKRDRNEYMELIKLKKYNYAINRGNQLSEAAQDKNPKTFWNFLKADRKAPDCKIKLEEWVEHFSSVLNPQQLREHEDNYLEQEQGELHENELLDGPITEAEIIYAINSLKSGKSPGIDGLTIQFFKACSIHIAPYLSTLFNFYFDNGFFPPEWSKSILCPIHKKGETNDPNNYRGVSLLSEFSKIFTFILNRRLKLWSEANNVIGNEQAGFRKEHTTIDQIFCLYTLITKYLRHKGGRFYALFVDFEKAFDRVDRAALWHKLMSQNVSSKMVRMLKAVYADVKVCVKSSECLSEMISCPVGVKQGCIISPILFTLFLNDLKDEIAIGSHGIDIETIKLFVLLFADDLVLFAETVIELQRLINRLIGYCSRWHVNVNLSKTMVIVFRNGGTLRNYERWKFNDTYLQVVTYYKYLGILISSRNSWYMCQKTLANQASKAWFAVKSRLSSFWNVNPNVLFKIFDCKILPILMYGSEVWFNHPSPDIEIVHNKFCKYVLNLPVQAPNCFVRCELGRHSLEPYKYIRAITYWLRILNLPNDRLPKVCYRLQKSWTETDTDCWATQIRNLLFRMGFGDVWLNQGVGQVPQFIKVFKTRVLDIDIQTQISDIQDMDKLRTYRLLKHDFGCEEYMFCITNRSFRTVFSKLRGGFLRIACNEGRYNNRSFDERLCPLCKTDIETEYHFLLVCPNLSHIRSKYISFIWYTYPSENKFIQLCMSKNKGIINNISRYVYNAMKYRKLTLSIE